MNVPSFVSLASLFAFVVIVFADYASPPDRIETVIYRQPTMAQVQTAMDVGLRKIEGEKPSCSPWAPMPELSE